MCIIVKQKSECVHNLAKFAFHDRRVKRADVQHSAVMLGNNDSHAHVFISAEQTRMLAARFEAGVPLAELVPTFMACERTPRAARCGGNITPYFGAALSRRRAEWHGEAGIHLKNLDKAKGGGVNEFVPWRAVFTSASMRPGARRDAILAEDGVNPDTMMVIVSEYVPTGALIIVRVLHANNNVAHDYALVTERTAIDHWWDRYGEWASHEQFFPPGLRLVRNKLPATITEGGWELSKMYRQYE